MGDAVKFRKVAMRERKPRRLTPEVLAELLMVHSSCVHVQAARPLNRIFECFCEEQDDHENRG